MSKLLSVIICTHNPRKDYLDRVLESLRNQTLPYNEWEFLIIDNCSSRPISEEWKIDWHPKTKIILEKNLGLTNARLKGISEAMGNLLVFVDDDNVLKENYLEIAMKIADERPYLGAWSGRVVPEYEEEPLPELVPHLWRLCIREVDKDAWGNLGHSDCMPWGAGMCVRKIVAQSYFEETSGNQLKALLGRKGQELGSSEDIDLALTSLDFGLGTGVFKSLHVLHLIPKRRVQEAYLLKLIEDSESLSVIYDRIRGIGQDSRRSFIDRLVDEYKFLSGSKLQRKIEKSFRRGRLKGKKISVNLSHGPCMPNQAIGGFKDKKH